jgi:hypothetical protein
MAQMYPVEQKEKSFVPVTENRRFSCVLHGHKACIFRTNAAANASAVCLVAAV